MLLHSQCNENHLSSVYATVFIVISNIAEDISEV